MLFFRFAEAHNCKMLANASLQYIEAHFVQILNEKEIYELPKEQIIKFLSSEYIRVDSECQVFQAALRWVTTDPLQRRRYVFDILKHVRLPLLSLSKKTKIIHIKPQNHIKILKLLQI